MATKPKRTKGNWRFSSNLIFSTTSGKLERICQLVNKSEKVNDANAQRICKAVNMHDELIEGLERAKKRIEYDNESHQSDYCKSVLRDIEYLLKQSEQ